MAGRVRLGDAGRPLMHCPFARMLVSLSRSRAWSLSALRSLTARIHVANCGSAEIQTGRTSLIGRMRSSTGEPLKCRWDPEAGSAQCKLVHGDASQGMHIIVQASLVAVVQGD